MTFKTLIINALQINLYHNPILMIVFIVAINIFICFPSIQQFGEKIFQSKYTGVGG